MSIKQLQKKIGVSADGIFGPKSIVRARNYYGLTNYQAAHFFGQCHHETGGFKKFEESFAYSADRLLQVFPRHFPSMSVARSYAGDPEAIANRVYGGRMGNGVAASGDGWLYRGRGAIQLTGFDNYVRFSQTGIVFAKVIDDPDLVATEFAFESAAHYFDKNNIWKIAGRGMNSDVIEAVTRKVNGGTHGIADREIQTMRYYAWLS